MKKPTQRDRVRAHLIEHGSSTNVEAVQMHILRLSERIRELEADGFSIRGDWVREGGKKTGTFRYTVDRETGSDEDEIRRRDARRGEGAGGEKR